MPNPSPSPTADRVHMAHSFFLEKDTALLLPQDLIFRLLTHEGWPVKSSAHAG